MTAPRPFDPAHDDAIRSVLVETVANGSRRGRSTRRISLFLSIAAACVLAIAGGGYAYASLHPASGGGGIAAVQTSPSVTSEQPEPSSSTKPSSSSSASGNEEPASTPTPTPLPTPITATTIKTPVILTPTAGEVFPAGVTSITYSGTGTPGTNIYLAVDCVDPGHPDDCSSAEEYGQAYLNNPIVVGTDGQWSYQATYAGTPNPVPEQIVMASSALVDAQGNTLRDSTGALIQSGHSEQITFYVG